MAAHCCQLYIHEKTKVDFVVFRGVVFISNLVAQRRVGATKHLDDTTTEQQFAPAVFWELGTAIAGLQHFGYYSQTWQ